ncbi:MAG: hypothetical protein CFH31_01112, partial [Alphaproteobacteria bacterium MarineAlpha9_Bin1]
MILIKQFKNHYLTHYIPAAIIALIAPMGYLAPLGEWLLMAFLSLTLLLNFMINPYKLNSYGLILFCAACGLIFCSIFWSISPARTAEVMLPKTGILFAILVAITASSNIKIKNIHINLGISLMFTAVIVFLDLILNAEIRSNLTQIAGDEPTSSSGNYSRGLLIMTILLPLVLSALLNKKFFIFATVLFLLASFSILLGPNSTAKITLVLSVVVAFIIYFLGPKSFLISSIIMIFWIISAPYLIQKTIPHLVNIEKHAVIYRTCDTEFTLKHPEWKNVVGKNNYCETTAPWQQKRSSLVHRLLIWDFVAKEVKKNIILGKGIGTSRLIGQNHILIIPQAEPDYLQNHIIRGAIPLHPHNNILQIWLELGAIGAILYTVLWIFILKFGNSLRKK